MKPMVMPPPLRGEALASRDRSRAAFLAASRCRVGSHRAASTASARSSSAGASRLFLSRFLPCAALPQAARSTACAAERNKNRHKASYLSTPVLTRAL